MQTSADLVAALESLQIFDADTLAEVRRLAGQCPHASGLVRELVGLGVITGFQAEKLSHEQPEALRVGQYALVDRVGAGGMGHVYKAVDVRTRRVACLKVIREELMESQKLLKRFEREWKAVSRMQHPNIVAAYDAGESGEAIYYAMEFVDGIDLGRHVQNVGPLPVPDAVSYTRQAALALKHAHEAGLIHRDIKPDNFLLEEATGQVKLLDLGLCRVEPNPGEDAATALTVRGTAIGTPEYMAPEQIRDASSVDARADVYALGCTLYYLLTGNDPFRGKSPMDVMLMQVKQEPAAIEKTRADAPPAVVWAVSKMMKKKPDDRFQTAADVVAYFDRLLAEPPSAWATLPPGLGLDGKAKPKAVGRSSQAVNVSAAVNRSVVAPPPEHAAGPADDRPAASAGAVTVLLAGSAAFLGGLALWWFNAGR